MKSVIFLLSLISFQLNAQIMLGPYSVGQFSNEIVYVGTYQSPGTCTFNDGTDFTLDFSGLYLPSGLQFALVVDAPSPSNTFLMNGWQVVNVGDSTTFTASTQGLGISAASGPATINFHVRVVGTPTASGEEYPCWITEGVTEALCGNTYALFPGESLVPCFVSPSVGIDEPDHSLVDIKVNQGLLSLISDQKGNVSVFNIEGQKLISNSVVLGKTEIDLSVFSAGTYIVQFEGQNSTFSEKILLQ